MIDLEKIQTLNQLQTYSVDQIIDQSCQVQGYFYSEFMNGLPFDEAMQLIRLAIWDAYKCFNEKKGVNFMLWMCSVIRNKIYTCIRVKYNLQKVFEKDMLRLDVEMNHEKERDYIENIADPHTPDPAGELIYEDRVIQAQEAINKYLFNGYKKSQRTHNILNDYYLKYLTHKEMVKKYGKKYDNILIRFSDYIKREVKRGFIKVNIHSMDKDHIKKFNINTRSFKCLESGRKLQWYKKLHKINKWEL